MQDLTLAAQGAAENDETFIDQGVHEAGVLLPAILLTQTA